MYVLAINEVVYIGYVDGPHACPSVLFVPDISW